MCSAHTHSARAAPFWPPPQNSATMNATFRRPFALCPPAMPAGCGAWGVVHPCPAERLDFSSAFRAGHGHGAWAALVHETQDRRFRCIRMLGVSLQNAQRRATPDPELRARWRIGGLAAGSDLDARGAGRPPITHAVRVPQRWFCGRFVSPSTPRLGCDITWLSAHEEETVSTTTCSRQVGAQLPPSAWPCCSCTCTGAWNAIRGWWRAARWQFPLNQRHIADALGLSLVRTQDAARRLSAWVCCELKNGRLRVLNTGRWRALPSSTTKPPRLLPLL